MFKLLIPICLQRQLLMTGLACVCLSGPRWHENENKKIMGGKGADN